MYSKSKNINALSLQSSQKCAIDKKDEQMFDKEE